MDAKPKILNAPGHCLRKRRDGWAVVWQAHTKAVLRGYRPTSIRVAIVGNFPTDEECAFISDTCNAFQNDMHTWVAGGPPATGLFDGTIAGLIAAYLSDPQSPFKKKRYATKINYEAFLRRIKEDHGNVRIANIKARDLLEWHENWLKRGVTMAHGLITVLRIILKFGGTILDDPACRHVRHEILADMNFEMGHHRESIITAEQATAVRARLHSEGHHSMALAQAIQFDHMLRQKDVIGEFVPHAEPGLSSVTTANKKWLRGITWEEIDADLHLKHITSKRGKPIDVDMKLAPMVAEELNRLYPGLIMQNEVTLAYTVNRALAPASGPVIVCESTGLPWDANAYRKHWRAAATACGIPKTVRNMDSRAGAISEASDAGADMEKIRHAATHSDIATTQGYSRNSAEKTADVMRLRVAHRNKGETK